MKTVQQQNGTQKGISKSKVLINILKSIGITLVLLISAILIMIIIGTLFSLLEKVPGIVYLVGAIIAFFAIMTSLIYTTFYKNKEK